MNLSMVISIVIYNVYKHTKTNNTKTCLIDDRLAELQKFAKGGLRDVGNRCPKVVVLFVRQEEGM